MPPIAESCPTTTSPTDPILTHEASPASPTLTTHHHPHDHQESCSPDDLQGSQKPASSPKNLERYSLDRSARDCLQLEPCLHSQRMLRQAALILQTMGQDRPAPALDGRRQSAPAFGKDKDRSLAAGMPPLVFDGPEEKKRTFELALAALNYQVVFEDILQDSDFFQYHPELCQERELVMVVLWDYQSRKFQARRWGKEGPEEKEGEGEGWEVIRHIDAALNAQRTKLKACLARRRIKASAPKIEFLLPDSIRRRSCSQKLMPICAWVNTLKTQMTEVLETLQSEGLSYLGSPPQGGGQQFQGRGFYQDPHCRDLLIFSADCGPLLQQHALLQEAHLVFQDKSWCLAAHSLLPLSTDTNDVLVVNPGPGWVVAHLSVLLQQHRGRVIVISTHEDQDRDNMINNLEAVGVSNKVKVIQEPLTRLRTDDARLKNVTSALVIADCSKSAISNIVQYIVLEGENTKELGKVSEPEDLDSHLTALQANHVAHLRAALTFPRMRGVVYLTRSVHGEENEAVVDRALTQVNAVQRTTTPPGASQPPWMLVAPVLPFSATDVEQRHGLRDKYVRFPPSDLTNGCFLVCLARKPEDPGLIISRAKAKGLLGKAAKAKKTSPSREDGGAGGDHVDNPHPPLRKDSLGKRTKVLRRLSSPVWPPAQKVADYKIPEHHKVIFHPTPFK